MKEKYGHECVSAWQSVVRLALPFARHFILYIKIEKENARLLPLNFGFNLEWQRETPSGGAGKEVEEREKD